MSAKEKKENQLESLTKKLDSRKLKKILIIVVGLQFLIIGATLFFVLQNKGGGGGNSSDSSASSFIPFLPVWIAVFIPILVLRKKEQTEGEKQRVLWVVLFWQV